MYVARVTRGERQSGVGGHLVVMKGHYVAMKVSMFDVWGAVPVCY